MNEFYIWFSTGFTHILDWQGYDHILYIMALCALYTYAEWKKLLTLVTAFTIGHSLTLAASVNHLISINQLYIEIIIPLTIMITCAINIVKLKYETPYLYNINYLFALLFGFVHGMGFSYLLKSMLGKEQSVMFPLLSFNIGLEIGQLLIVGLMILISAFLFIFTRIKKITFVYIISSIIFCVTTVLFLQRLNLY